MTGTGSDSETRVARLRRRLRDNLIVAGLALLAAATSTIAAILGDMSRISEFLRPLPERAVVLQQFHLAPQLDDVFSECTWSGELIADGRNPDLDPFLASSGGLRMWNGGRRSSGFSVVVPGERSAHVAEHGASEPRVPVNPAVGLTLFNRTAQIITLTAATIRLYHWQFGGDFVGDGERPSIVEVAHRYHFDLATLPFRDSPVQLDRDGLPYVTRTATVDLVPPIRFTVDHSLRIEAEILNSDGWTNDIAIVDLEFHFDPEFSVRTRPFGYSVTGFGCGRYDPDS